jgi:hypothetical protein
MAMRVVDAGTGDVRRLDGGGGEGIFDGKYNGVGGRAL